MCYFTNWSSKRKGKGRYEPEDIDGQLCTHVIYAFANIKEYKIVPTESVDLGEGAQKGYWDRILALKTKNPTLKVMLAVGGWMLGSAPFREITENTYR